MSRLIGKHTVHRKPYTVKVSGISLVMLPEVFCPAFTNTSEFLADNVEVFPGETVLDLFTGSGFQGIRAANAGAHVVCADHSAIAVECADLNVQLNGVADRVNVAHGDLFCPVGNERFDVIIANPPLLPGEPQCILETAVFDPGLSVTRRFLAELSHYLTPRGRAYLVVSDVSWRSEGLDVENMSAVHGLRRETLASKDVGYETYTIHLLRRAA